jgi:hypothetical protein
MPNIRERYEAILREAIEAGIVEKMDDPSERRQHPRLQLPFGMLRAEEIIPREMSDISLGGFNFHSVRAYDSNELVAVNFRGKFGAKARVVGCDAIRGSSDGVRYRVRCKFDDENEALLLLSSAMEMDKARSGGAAPQTGIVSPR